METQSTQEDIEEICRRFNRDSVNKNMALNFILGTLSAHVMQERILTPERLRQTLESALRFSRARK